MSMASSSEVLEYKFSVAECAKLMRVSKMTILRLVNAGDIPAYRVGKKWIIPMSAMREFLGSALKDVSQEVDDDE